MYSNVLDSYGKSDITHNISFDLFNKIIKKLGIEQEKCENLIDQIKYSKNEVVKIVSSQDFFLFAKD